MTTRLYLYFIRRLAAFLRSGLPNSHRRGANGIDARPTERQLSAESLEPRILYSAAPAPVEAPAPAPAAEEAPPAAEAPPAVAAPAVATAAANDTAVDASAAEAAPPASGDSDISPDQGVSLIDADEWNAPLNQQTLEAVADAAKQRWVDSGISTEQLEALDQVHYGILDLGGDNLGAAQSYAILVDDDGAGKGWFIDATPDEDEEFIASQGTLLNVAADSEEAGSVDLLTVLIHEQGHILGIDEHDHHSAGVMNDFLASGERRLPEFLEADAATPGPVAEMAFIKLNDPLPTNGNVSFGPLISADSSRVVYLADGDSDGVTELYSRAIDGTGAEVKLNDSLTFGGNVGLFSISPDSSRVVYRADGDSDGMNELYSRAIDGSGAEVKLNTSLPTSGDVLTFAISADSTRVVYLADGDINGVNELYSRAIDGSGVEVKLNSALPLSGDVLTFAISADSSRVVYRADGDENGVVELYSRAIDGSGVEVKLNDTLPSGGLVQSGFVISADSTRVVYRADADTDNVNELYSRAIDGSGSQVKLNDTPVTNGDVLSGFAISADSARVVYLADSDTDQVFELYSRAIDGSGSEVKLNDTLPLDGNVFVGFAISNDSSRVVFRADGDTDAIIELYSRAIDGTGSEVKVNDPLVLNGGVFDFAISADSSRVVYRADGDTDEAFELYSRAIDGSGSEVKLNDTLPSGDIVQAGFAISLDSTRAVYLAGSDAGGADELYSRAIDGSGSEVKVNTPLVSGGTVFDFSISADSSRVVYVADGDTAVVRELYSVPLPGAVLSPEIYIVHDLTNVLIADGDTTPTDINDEGTDFGQATIAGGMVTRTFVITNDGTADLTLSGQPTLSGNAGGHFTVSTLGGGALVLTPAEARTFTVTFDPLAVGVHTATVEIASDDADESNYDFLLTGEGTPPPPPEITVTFQDTSVEIPDGDTTPTDISDEGTDFGQATIAGGMVTRTFVIANDGTGDLILSGQPTLSGNAGGHFTVSTLSGGGLVLTPAETRSFTVTFDPSAVGIHTATVDVTSDDADESNYDFLLTGEGTPPPPPEITVTFQNTSVEIPDGDTTPTDISDEGTDFGQATIAGGMVTRTFVIANDGTGDLILSGQPTLSGNAGGHFTVSTLSGGGLVVAPAETRSFTVTFDPLAVGVHTATVEIASDDADESNYDFLLTGEGTSPPSTEETGISISGGDLVITDTLGGDTDDDLTISADGTNLTIVDNNGNGIDLGVVNGTGSGTDTVVISLSEWTGGLTVDSLAGDDRITIGGLTGILGSISVDGGLGFDRVKLTGDNTLAADANAGVTAEHIEGKAINLATSGTGTITLIATGSGPGAFQGIDLEDSTLSSQSGAIALTGEGGSGKNNNDGVRLDNTDLSTVDAGITIDGTGSGTGSKNRGVYLFGGSNITAGGFGSLSIVGTGSSTATSHNAGVFLNSASQLSTGDGDLTITGTGDGSASSNYGVYALRTTFSTNDGSASGGHVTITGNGSATATGNSNAGVFFNTGIQITALGSASTIDIDGTAGANGNNNGYGLYVKNSTGITANGGDISLNGTGNGSGSNGRGVFITGVDSDVTTTAAGAIAITGIGGSGTNNNQGVHLSKGALMTVDGDITVAGSGNGSGSSNYGVLTLRATFDTNAGAASSGHVAITGIGSAAATGNNNAGVYLNTANRITVLGSAGTIDIDGTAGANGKNNGNGVYIKNALGITANGGDISIDGTANGIGNNGRGVYITGAASDVTTTGTGAIAVAGLGAGGVNNNQGVFLKSGSLMTVDGGITVIGASNGNKSSNSGVRFQNAAVTSSGGGDLLIEGTAGSAATGANNRGVYLLKSTVTATDGELSINGTGGGGTKTNIGVHVVAGSTQSANGATDITGDALGSTSSANNMGVYLQTGAVAGTSLTVTGGGGSGTNSNYGVYSNKSTMRATAGTTQVFGTANATTIGKLNHGIFLRSAVTESSSNLWVQGTGGGGTSSNQGLRIDRGSATANGGSASYRGEALDTTSLKDNSGVHIKSATVGGSIAATVTGTGGTGTGGLNHGIFMNGITAFGGLIITDGTAGTGPGSEAETGNFFS